MPKPTRRQAKKSVAAKRPPARSPTRVPLTPADAPRLLSGGNPQIPKGYGERAVKDYLAAMPGWERDVGRTLDAMITRAVPNVRKAVKWNSPLYGIGECDVWFLSMHCFAKYIKVAFFRGAQLQPPPPNASKQRLVRYLDVYEGWRDSNGNPIEEAQLVAWIEQASRLPGEKM